MLEGVLGSGRGLSVCFLVLRGGVDCSLILSTEGCGSMRSWVCVAAVLQSPQLPARLKNCHRRLPWMPTCRKMYKSEAARVYNLWPAVQTGVVKSCFDGKKLPNAKKPREVYVACFPGATR